MAALPRRSPGVGLWRFLGVRVAFVGRPGRAGFVGPTVLDPAVLDLADLTLTVVEIAVPGGIGLGVGFGWRCGGGGMAFEDRHGAFERLTGDLHPDPGQSF